MKRRWSVLFWSSLSALIGMSWLARGLDMSLSVLVSAALLGMIAACAIAFYAMIKVVPDKWPAAVALVCAGPMGLEMLRVLPDIAWIVDYFGLSFGLIIVGTIATVASAIGILSMPTPRPPQPPQVPPAHVV